MIWASVGYTSERTGMLEYAAAYLRKPGRVATGGDRRCYERFESTVARSHRRGLTEREANTGSADQQSSGSQVRLAVSTGSADHLIGEPHREHDLGGALSAGEGAFDASAARATVTRYRLSRRTSL